VLPAAFGRLSIPEINIFLATELFRARRRMAGHATDLTGEETDMFDRLRRQFAAKSGMMLLDREQAYRRAEKEIVGTIVRV